MTRTLLTAAAGAGLLALGAPAQAAPPKPADIPPFTLPSQVDEGANGFCEDFPVRVEVESFQETRGGGSSLAEGPQS